jgi:hypothetical protein
MTKIKKAIKDVMQRRAQRICVPGQWRVSREGDTIRIEIFERAVS